MNVYKRGGVYWLRFTYKGQLIRKSTHLTNAQKARDYASAFRTKLINGEVGIQERKPIPSLSKAMKDFLAWSEHEHRAHPRTHHRYETSAVALKRYFKDVRLDQITPEDGCAQNCLKQLAKCLLMSRLQKNSISAEQHFIAIWRGIISL